jgi:hypothetical protein
MDPKDAMKPKDIDFEIVVIKPFGTKLKPAEFFRIFEQFLKVYQLDMKDAYELTTDYCIYKRLSLSYSSFDSFQRAYYKQIKAQMCKSAPF